MKKLLIFLLAISSASLVFSQGIDKSKISKAELRPADYGISNATDGVSSGTVAKPHSTGKALSSQLKISMSSSLNVNGLFSYDERYLTLIPETGMITFGNRAGGVFGNTGNDLKFKFSSDQGNTWDSAVVTKEGTNLMRYPSMVVYNPAGNTNPANMFGIFSGPITDGTNWVSQYYGSIRLDGQFRNSTYTPNVTGTYLNHMDVGLNVTADGHAHVASNLLTGTSSSYTQDGWNVLNGTFNAANKNFDWQIPYVHVQPALLASGRIDASGLDWSPDGTTGYLLGTAIDADLAYNPYGIEWPVVYKSADQGVTWNKIPAFDFSTIGITWEKLYPTRSNLSLVIPRWYNKWVGGESNNGTTVDIKGNLHIFSLLRSTLSTNADSLNYFYTLEPNQLFDVFMAPGGGWNAIYIDTLMSTVVAAPGTYGIGWDHQMQMTRTPDGSKVFCVWTDTNPGLWGNSITDNSLPDLKAIGYDVVNNVYTNVKNFTELGLYWAENYWMRVGDKVVVNAGTYTLPVTTSIPGATNNDPLIHQYFQGIDFTDADFINVGIPTVKANTSYDLVSQNYPNPCKGLSRVTVNLKEASRLHLVVNDLMGRNVFELPAFNAQPGAQMLVIDASKLSPGVYTYTVSVNHVDITKKMIVK